MDILFLTVKHITKEQEPCIIWDPLLIFSYTTSKRLPIPLLYSVSWMEPSLPDYATLALFLFSPQAHHWDFIHLNSALAITSQVSQNHLFF